ncbi:MAG: hypothetical protein IPJ76_16750 [Flavobacteriales bacterium]|nr:MAG: hypothetical protein IPJ76_16750 [Flavobacteriales bacterium]
MVRLAVCPYRLLFKHPFGTAHGIRTGTDSVFVRLEQDGVFGYGEATMPPYVAENQRTVLDRLAAWSGLQLSLPNDLGKALAQIDHWITEAPSARAALSMALVDLAGKLTSQPAWQLLEAPVPQGGRMMMTLGLCDLSEIPSRLEELPPVEVLKVKLNGENDVDRLQAVVRDWTRALFLDVNQGWKTNAQAEDVLGFINGCKVLGVEQPYEKNDLALNGWLQSRTELVVFADETVQGPADVRDKGAGFNGVNIKLQKCGGPDVARAMAKEILGLGKQVMLGSMSESSLGCTAAAHLSGLVGLLDLDGPWLIGNDPFVGLELYQGSVKMPDRPGLGTELTADLRFAPYGA